MSKHLTAGRVARYLLFLVIACAVVLGVSFARYVTVVQGQGLGQVAGVALDVSGDGAVDVTSQLRGMKPGDTRTVGFTVTNEKDGTVSEVAQEYSVSVETTGNLPLTYALTASGEAGSGSFVGGSGLSWAGGVLPYGSASHSYTLMVSWPEDAAGSVFADEIDRVVLRVDAHQAAPTEAT